MNKFGVGVSSDTMSRDIVKAILNNLSDEKIRSELNSNHDSFKVATSDNIDRNIKSGEIVFGKKKQQQRTREHACHHHSVSYTWSRPLQKYCIRLLLICDTKK